MDKVFNISFPGGRRVDTSFKDFTIKTDQSKKNGGDSSAPEPFDLFFASLATCAGITLQTFCQRRELNTQGLSLQLRAIRNEEKRLYTNIIYKVKLPPDFPADSRADVERVISQCTVKKHIDNPPDFEVSFVN